MATPQMAPSRKHTWILYKFGTDVGSRNEEEGGRGGEDDGDAAYECLLSV